MKRTRGAVSRKHDAGTRNDEFIADEHVDAIVLDRRNRWERIPDEALRIQSIGLQRGAVMQLDLIRIRTCYQQPIETYQVIALGLAS